VFATVFCRSWLIPRVIAMATALARSLTRKVTASCRICCQLREDCHGLAFERGAAGKVSCQSRREGFRPFEGGTCTGHSCRLPCPLLAPVGRYLPPAMGVLRAVLALSRAPVASAPSASGLSRDVLRLS
jgi:hypothetical protein